MPSSAPITLVEDRLYALPNPYRLDGRVTSHPPDARGWTCMNCFLLVEGSSALLLETGFTVHEESLLGQLAALLGPETELSIFPLSPGEFRSGCNVRPIMDRFNVVKLYGVHENARYWADFRPELVPPGAEVGAGKLGTVPVEIVRSTGGSIAVDGAGRRTVDAFAPGLRLLPTHWVYDPATKALFTSDLFTHVWRPTEQGPWTVSHTDDGPGSDDLIDYLVRTRFWWLPGARTEALVRELTTIVDQYEIEVLAPSYGCVFLGRDVVARQVELLLEALANFGKQRSVYQGPVHARP